MSGEEINAQITAVGEEIRQLKASKADKATIDGKVANLLTLKKQYKEATGNEWAAEAAPKEKKAVAAQAVDPNKVVDPAVAAAREAKKQQEKEEKAKKEAEKAQRAADRAAPKKEKVADAVDGSAIVAVAIPNLTIADMADESKTFGNLFIQSAGTTKRVWHHVVDLNASKSGSSGWLRCRVQTVRPQGAKLAFLVLRQNKQGYVATIQAVAFGAEIAYFCSKLTKESVVDVEFSVTKPNEPIKACTVQDAELSVKRIFCVSSSLPALPFELADASRTEAELEEKDEKGNLKYVRVGQDTRLDNRIIDFRTRANAAIMRIASGVCQLFREALLAEGFTEIHTPKLIASASEGGADVFKLGYFGKDAFLAQSPQLYKQMVLSGDMDRVFEIGPVFRSENSHTHRHLCEFTGLDMEMTFHETYHEVLEMMDYMFTYIFDGLNYRFRKEIEAVREQYPFEDLKYKTRNSLRLTFSEGVQILKNRGPSILEKRIAACTDEREVAKMREHIAKINAHGLLEDISTADEKLLGVCVREEHDTDFYVLDQFPTDVRPFYTMPHPTTPGVTNSYDWFIRGEEICSGAQRIHDSAMLLQRIKEKGVPPGPLMDYVNAFSYGAFPHAGCGVGMERIVMLFLGLDNIRKVSMFPRDPMRCTP